MPTLTIRNVPKAVHRELRIRAARAGRSMEAEVRAILRAACSPTSRPTAPSVLRDWVEEVYGGEKPSGVVEDLIAERRRESERE